MDFLFLYPKFLFTQNILRYPSFFNTLIYTNYFTLSKVKHHVTLIIPKLKCLLKRKNSIKNKAIFQSFFEQ
ncbi:hypothetical protein EGW38_12520 [Enterococcus faecium]|nr:hypothetical protein CUM94_12830 [Enterococcus faecium]ROW93310.1 hypothetical protein EGW09_12665 [Enterococcus faecium]ROX45708.1 hypothetical protein EGW18_12665 [Enterococcus faecium]ROX76693.1 hypothetical protein EGW38_12520 [Enterococcus faecium]ROY27600.1 hypothetical protein EGW50_12620 [Enterococcus faecium]